MDVESDKRHLLSTPPAYYSSPAGRTPSSANNLPPTFITINSDSEENEKSPCKIRLVNLKHLTEADSGGEEADNHYDNRQDKHIKDSQGCAKNAVSTISLQKDSVPFHTQYQQHTYRSRLTTEQISKDAPDQLASSVSSADHMVTAHATLQSIDGVGPLSNSKFESCAVLRAKHGKDRSNGNLSCVCGKQFSSPAGLYLHIVKLTQRPKFSCQVCQKKYHFLSALKRHHSFAHKSQVFWTGDQVGCSRCGKVLQNRKEKKGHLNYRNERCEGVKVKVTKVGLGQGGSAGTRKKAAMNFTEQQNQQQGGGDENEENVDMSTIVGREVNKDISPGFAAGGGSSHAVPTFAVAPTTLNHRILLKPPVLSCFSIGRGLFFGQQPPKMHAAPANVQPASAQVVPSKTLLSAAPRTALSGLPRLIPAGGFNVKVCQANKSSEVNSTPQQNILIQSLQRENHQLKIFRKDAVTKLREREDAIKNLKEVNEKYKKIVLELKLQNEVFVARENHIVEEILEEMHNVIHKVTRFAHVDPTSNSPSISALSGKSRNNNSFALHGVESRLKVLEENTNQKLEQILAYVTGCRQPQPSYHRSPNVTEIVAQTSPAPGYGSQEHVLSFEQATEEEDNTEIISDADVEAVLRSELTTPPLIPYKNSPDTSSCTQEAPLKIETRRQKRLKAQKKDSRRKKRDAKRSKREKEVVKIFNDENDDGPPNLSLPARLVKNNQRRPQSMPVLLPEISVLRDRNERLENEETASKTKPLSIMAMGRRTVRSKAKTLSNTHNVVQLHFDPPHPSTKKVLSSKSITKPLVGGGLLHVRDESKPGFACSCGSKFTGAGGLYVHQVKQNETEKFHCALCGKRFHYFSGLKAHRKATHKLNLTKEVGCSRCGKIFACKAERQGHVDARGRTCWLSGSYQNKDGMNIRKRVSSMSTES